MANRLKDLTGQTFGLLYVLERDNTKKHSKPYWICRCECGTIKSIRGSHLTEKDKPTRSCGCLAKQNAAKLCKQRINDLTGEKFGDLTVIERVYPEKVDSKRTYWKCRCVCGKEIIVRGDTLKTQLSCGCSSISKGERRISEILTNLGVAFETQKTFSDLKDKGFLRLDFYIPEQKIAIEYQGQQHYYETDGFFKGGLEERQRRDQIKRDYCIKNNIQLIEIPYWDYSKIDEIYIKNILVM